MSLSLRNSILTTAITAALAIAHSASAVLIPMSARLGDNPADPGDGLNAEFWDHDAAITTIAEALTVAESRSADATFTSTLIDYPNGAGGSIADTNTLSTFLGVDAASLSGLGDTTLEQSVYRFSGFISITAADDRFPGGLINVSFGSQNDDGIRLRIGGQASIIENNLQGFGAFATGFAEFEEPGLYAIEIIFFENGGNTGIELSTSISGGPARGGPDGLVGLLPTARLFTESPFEEPGGGNGGGVIPAPAALPAGLLLLGLMGLRRRGPGTT